VEARKRKPSAFKNSRILTAQDIFKMQMKKLSNIAGIRENKEIRSRNSTFDTLDSQQMSKSISNHLIKSVLSSPNKKHFSPEWYASIIRLNIHHFII